MVVERCGYGNAPAVGDWDSVVASVQGWGGPCGHSTPRRSRIPGRRGGGLTQAAVTCGTGARCRAGAGVGGQPVAQVGPSSELSRLTAGRRLVR